MPTGPNAGMCLAPGAMRLFPFVCGCTAATGLCLTANTNMKFRNIIMFAMTESAGSLAETLRMIRATIRRLTAVTTAEPAPYWTDYLRDTRGRDAQ
jgi:hypothetical protein